MYHTLLFNVAISVSAQKELPLAVVSSHVSDSRGYSPWHSWTPSVEKLPAAPIIILSARSVELCWPSALQFYRMWARERGRYQTRTMREYGVSGILVFVRSRREHPASAGYYCQCRGAFWKSFLQHAHAVLFSFISTCGDIIRLEATCRIIFPEQNAIFTVLISLFIGSILGGSNPFLYFLQIQMFQGHV